MDPPLDAGIAAKPECVVGVVSTTASLLPAFGPGPLAR